MGAPPWNAEALRRQLEPLWPGLEVEVVAETGSTNSDLLSRLRELRGAGRGAAGLRPCLRAAETQTAGRGRHGRSWCSAPGDSLTFSLAVPLARPDWSGLSLAVGVAVAEALEPEPAGRPQLGLKWPNDLWLVDAHGAGRKLGGVLIEALAGAPDGAARVAVIGIGLNVRRWAAPADLASGFACVQELDGRAEAGPLLGPVAAAVLAALRRFETEGFAGFERGFAARDLLFGQEVLTTDAARVAGRAAGVSAQGGLLVRTADGVCREVASGEVSVRLARPPAGIRQPC